MKYVAFTPFKYLQYVEAVLTVPITKETRGIIALDSDGQPCAVILLDGWTHNAATCHIAVQKPMALRGLLTETAEYVFNTCQKQMLIGITESSHKKALRLNEHMGFTELYRIKDCYAPGVDQIILQMKKADCKYLTAEQRLQEVA